jgi:hypothetical protein
MVRRNLVYDLLQTTKISSSAVDVKREKRTDQIYFVICNSCHWCATYFGIDASLSPLIACHGCSLHNTELIPIEIDESFRIE